MHVSSYSSSGEETLTTPRAGSVAKRNTLTLTDDQHQSGQTILVQDEDKTKQNKTQILLFIPGNRLYVKNPRDQGKGDRVLKILGNSLS